MTHLLAARLRSSELQYRKQQQSVLSHLKTSIVRITLTVNNETSPTHVFHAMIECIAHAVDTLIIPAIQASSDYPVIMYALYSKDGFDWSLSLPKTHHHDDMNHESIIDDHSKKATFQLLSR